jgi:hypothetical protein
MAAAPAFLSKATNKRSFRKGLLVFYKSYVILKENKIKL